jgi:hypothetical protein
MNSWYYGGDTFFPGSDVMPAVESYGQGELVEEDVRCPDSGVWHHARCGITDPNDPGSHVVHWYWTHCDIYVRSGYGWQAPDSVKKNERCKQCRW